MAKTQKNTQSTKADLVIIGAGSAGLTLAALLGRIGLNIHIVEPYPPKAFDQTETSGRTVALMQSSLQILKAAGLGDFCAQYGEDLKIMRVFDDSVEGQPPLESEFDSFDIGLERFGMNIPNSLLRAKLYEIVSALKTVTIHANNSLADYTIDNNIVCVTLEKGEQITTPLIIGADGRGSLVRKIAGIKTHDKDYGQSAITFVINHSRAHDNVSTEFHRAGGPFALVPMKGNQSSIVWVENTDKADELMTLAKDAFEVALQKATNDILGAVTLDSAPQSWPLKAMTAKSLIAPRVALIAEAAHVMSPITAQGLNLSLRDIATLAEVIVDGVRLGVDYGGQSILRKYARRRAPDVTTRTFGVSTLNQFVNTDSAPLKDLRRAGLRLIERLSPVKMIAMQHGLAPTLDQGRLVRGEAL